MLHSDRLFQLAQTQSQYPKVNEGCAPVGRDNWIGELDFSANQAPGAQTGWLSQLADALPCSSFPNVWG